VHIFIRFFSTIFLFLTFLNIHIYFIILKAYDQQFTLTIKNHCISSLRARTVSLRQLSYLLFSTFISMIQKPTSKSCMHYRYATSSSAIAEGPCDALSQLKSCQLLHNCMKNITGRFFGLVTKHVCDRQMDGRTELRLPRPR